jgi:hypothetical protein
LKEIEKELKNKITFYSQNPKMPQGLMWYEYDRWAPHDFRKDDCFFAKDIKGEMHVWIMKENLMPEQNQQGFKLEGTDNPRHFIIRTSNDKVSVGGKKQCELALKGNDGKISKFAFEMEEIYWNVKYYKTGNVDFQDQKAWDNLFSKKPEHEMVQGRLADLWKNEQKLGSAWAFFATTKYDFPEGNYKFITVSDDGVKVYVDDKLIINNWTRHAEETDTAMISLKGTHTINVYYCQAGGGSAFSIDWYKSK